MIFASRFCLPIGYESNSFEIHLRHSALQIVECLEGLPNYKLLPNNADYTNGKTKEVFVESLPNKLHRYIKFLLHSYHTNTMVEFELSVEYDTV